MDFSNIKEGRDPMPDVVLDTSRNLTSHLQNEEAGTLICAAMLGIDATLRDMRESGLFCKDEIDEMLQSDSKTITVSKDQVILKWVKIGPSASEIRQFTINHAPDAD
jgi:hypothetical protein